MVSSQRWIGVLVHLVVLCCQDHSRIIQRTSSHPIEDNDLSTPLQYSWTSRARGKKENECLLLEEAKAKGKKMSEDDERRIHTHSRRYNIDVYMQMSEKERTNERDEGQCSDGRRSLFLFLQSTRKNRSTTRYAMIRSNGKESSEAAELHWLVSDSISLQRRTGDEVIVWCSAMKYRCIVRMTEMFLFILLPWSSYQPMM